METDFDVIIIGAGPAGSSAAILLAREGWRVAVIEKQAFPRRKVCGECIAASNLPLLDILGIGASFSRLAGPPLRQLALICGDHQMICAALPPYPDPKCKWGMALGRERLDALLLEQARQCGATIFQPWQAYRVDGSPGMIRCHARATGSRQERTLSAALMIDAHGSWEPMTMRDAAHRDCHQASDMFAFKANFAGARFERGLLPVLSFRGGYGGMVIGEEGMATWAFCLRRDALAQARSGFVGIGAPEAAAQWVMQHCRQVPLLLAGAARQGKWLGSGPIRPGIHITRRFAAAFCIGNAAGEAHPIIGEGISMAIQSARLLTDMLLPCRTDIADGKVQARIQAEYAKAWRRHFAGRLHWAALFAHAAMRPEIYGGLLPLLKRYPALLGHFARWSGKVRPAPDHGNINDNQALSR